MYTISSMVPKGLCATRSKSFYDACRSLIGCRCALSRSPAQRPTDELIQLYALECFLDRLTRSAFSSNFVRKGGVLLAALDARLATRDIDVAALSLRNTKAEILACATLRPSRWMTVWRLTPAQATAEVIREKEDYSGTLVPLFACTSM
jgi:hypothetical protein